MIALRALLLLGLVSSALSLWADVPLLPPKRHEVMSPSKKYVAVVDPKLGVSVRAAGSTQVAWSASNIWSRQAFLADDGEHFVTGYNGLNLIPQNYRRDLVLITFWKRNQKVREVTVGELFPDTSVLVRTASHYHWGGISGINGNILSVRRCDNVSLRFDVTTGKQVND